MHTFWVKFECTTECRNGYLDWSRRSLLQGFYSFAPLRRSQSRPFKKLSFCQERQTKRQTISVNLCQIEIVQCGENMGVEVKCFS